MSPRALLPIATFIFYTLFSFAGGQSPVSEVKDFKSTTSRTDFGSYSVSDGSNVEVVKDFISHHISNLQGKHVGVQLTHSSKSPGGYHYTFTQTFEGIPVFSSDVMVNVSNTNQVYSIFDDSYDVSKWNVNTTDFNYQDVASYTSYLKQHFTNDVIQSAHKIVAYDEKTNAAMLCYEVNLKDNSGHQRNVLVAADKIVYERDANMYRAAAAPDSLVSGMVFRPDPLTTAHTVYYGSYNGHDSAYQDFNNVDTPQLNLQRQSKTFYTDFQDSVFYLRNQYIRLGTLGGNTIAPVTSTTPVFNYTRSQLGFLDVMTFYHLNVMRSYVHDLGFNMADSFVTADSHALSADNDFFSQPNSLFYGTGGVPDCQDADVIVHEYTHFLSWNANQSNGFGASSQRQSIDEGSCDYNAGSYSASIDTFGWYRMFSWDGHNEYWNGRFLNDVSVYPTVPNTPGLTGIYKYSVIWSSALMQIWFEIGRGPTDSLFFETLYGLASNIVLPDAAQQYIKADSALYNGKYHCTIVKAFHDHGLASDRACGLYPAGTSDIAGVEEAVRFTAYPDGFKAESNQPNTLIDIVVYDIAGQRLSSYRNVSGEIKPDYLPAGIYVIDVSTPSGHKGYKWALVK